MARITGVPTSPSAGNEITGSDGNTYRYNGNGWVPYVTGSSGGGSDSGLDGFEASPARTLRSDTDNTDISIVGRGTGDVIITDLATPTSFTMPVDIRFIAASMFAIGTEGTATSLTLGGASRTVTPYTAHGLTLYYISGVTVSGNSIIAGSTDIWSFSNTAPTSTNSWNAFA